MTQCNEMLTTEGVFQINAKKNVWNRCNDMIISRDMNYFKLQDFVHNSL